MKRAAIVVVIIAALAAIGLNSPSDAQAPSPFDSSWCESPVVVPIAIADATSTRTADGVATARGAEAALSSLGPVVRMEELGSRVQVTLGETLFHTQWLFAGVGADDSVRIDARLGRARQPLEASSIRGALTEAPETDGPGLVAVGADTVQSTAEIAVFSAVTEVLFTNEGEGALDLVAAVGCPALRLQSDVLATPRWDASSQRFLAEHEITISNELAQPKTRALRVLNPAAASTTIDDLTIDVAVAAEGFVRAEIVAIDMSEPLRERWSEDFDGVIDTGLLSVPLRLTENEPLRLQFTVAYEPDFDDPSWSEGVDAPAPVIQIRGEVDDVAVGLSAVLRNGGAEIDSVVEPNRLITPAPGLVVDHTFIKEPTSSADGLVSMVEQLTVTNVGETAIVDLRIEYPNVAMYGAGSRLVEVAISGPAGCADGSQSDFDGAGQPVVIRRPGGLDVGSTCTVELRSTILPGVVPAADGTEYETAAVATARSGRRDVRDARAVQVELAQRPAIGVVSADPVITNLSDGRYQIDGEINVTNMGDQDLDEVSSRISIAISDDEVSRAASVSVESLTGGDDCVARSTPSRAVDSVGLFRNVVLPVGDSCTISFVLIARPGPLLDGWSIEATARAESPRAVTVTAPKRVDTFELPEAPFVETNIDVADVRNNADGTYTVDFDTIISNTGDTPLVDVLVPDAASTVFGEHLLSSDTTVDTCRRVSGRRPLASTSPPSTCQVSRTVLVEPAMELAGWLMTASTDAASPSGARVAAGASTPSIDFVEKPSLATSLSLDEVERLDDGRFRFFVSGTLTNNGDIELRDVATTIDLAATFGSITFEVVDLSSRTLRLERSFDGQEQIGLLREGNRLLVEEVAQWNLVLLADTRTNFGPFEVSAQGGAVSPAGQILGPDTISFSRALPLVQIIDRSLTSSNNNDGTYIVEHGVSARNVGGVSLAGISVRTNFVDVFGAVIVGDTVVESTCDSTVLNAEVCSVTERAVIRPGAAIGPYAVDVSISSSDEAEVQALVVAQPYSILFGPRALSPLLLEESPSIALSGEAGSTVNNGDGTYSMIYRFAVRNAGDVPLYRIGGVDPVNETFDEILVENRVLLDTCAGVTFAQPLAPNAICEREHQVRVRPGAMLGPWTLMAEVSADTPAFATVTDSIELEARTFTESVSVEAEVSLVALQNNGDGTYAVGYELVTTNTGDVPVVDLSISDAGSVFGDRRLTERKIVDDCSDISSDAALAPGSTCRVQVEIRVRPGSDLGPFTLTSELAGTSPSGAVSNTEATTSPLTLTESPAFTLSSEVQSVESTDDETLRVIVDLAMVNSGDVRLDDVQFELDLRELFPSGGFRVDALISNDVEISETFAAEESVEMFVSGQSLSVGENFLVTLIVSLTPDGSVGPFVGELRASGQSPAEQTVTAVVGSQIDLPSVSIETVAQRIDNNRDGSYMVTISYAITNDGSTPLEFVRLLEDLDTVYEGVNAELVTVHSDDVRLVDLRADNRGTDILDWGVELAVSETAVVTTSVLVTPGNVLGPFLPAAQTTAVSPTGTDVVAVLSSATAIEFVESPALRIEQELLGRPVWNPDGTFDVSFSIELINDGDVELRNMQVNQDLLRALGAGSSIDVQDIRSTELSVNSDFDGLGEGAVDLVEEADDEIERSQLGDTRLLVGGDTLDAGAQATIELDMTIAPENRGVYSTRTIVSGRTPGGAGLGSTGDEIEANTLTRLSVEGELGVAKQVIGEPNVRPDGGVAVTYEILVENAGPFPLMNVQVHDQLGQAFGTGSTFVTSSVRIEGESPCSGHASASYDGGAIDPVLVSGVQLEPGERCRLQYDAVVFPSKALPGPFRSSAFAIGADPFSGIVIDDSTDGTNTDPDGNQEPGDNDIATAVRVEIPQPAVRLDVLVTEVSERIDDNWLDVTLDATITNVGPIDIDSTQLIADLDEDIDGPFELLSVTSDGLLIDDEFDGDDRTNLVTRRNRIRSGESVSLSVQLRLARSDSTAIPTNFAFSARSVTGVVIAAVADSPVVIDIPNSSRAGSDNLFSRLSVEEQRLLVLGASAFMLFFVIFVYRSVNRLRVAREQRSQRRVGRGAIDLRETIDLRARPHVRRHNTGDHLHTDRHHSPRRRRGRGRRIDH